MSRGFVLSLVLSRKLIVHAPSPCHTASILVVVSSKKLICVRLMSTSVGSSGSVRVRCAVCRWSLIGLQVSKSNFTKSLIISSLMRSSFSGVRMHLFLILHLTRSGRTAPSGSLAWLVVAQSPQCRHPLLPEPEKGRLMVPLSVY